MKKITLTVGAPGSGKTTWAIKQAQSNPGTVIACMDDIRTAMNGGVYKYSKAKESLVKSLLIAQIQTYLDNKDTRHIIVANTNLNYAFKEQLIKSLNGQFTVHEELFDVNWPTLVKRNNTRGDKAVPIDVLRMFYKKMQQYTGKHKEYIADFTKPQAIIFDMDGTLADNSHRSAFDFDKLGDDKIRPIVAGLLKMYKKENFKIIIVSGRNAGTLDDPLKYFKLTRDWLVKHKLPFDAIFMRDADDFRKDDEVKEEIFFNKIAPNYNVNLAVDDRQQVVEMWRRIGVECWQVATGDF